MSNTNSNAEKLFQKEEEYKRLNAKLEAQTAKLVEEAEEMMKEQDSFLNQVSPQHNSMRNSLSKSRSDETAIVDVIGRDTDLLSIAAGGFDHDYSDEEGVEDFPHHERGVNSLAELNTKHSFEKKSQKASGRKHLSLKTSSALSYNTVTNKDKLLDGVKEVKNDNILDVAEEMGAEAQIRFLKAKLRVLQEELNDQIKQGLMTAEEYKKCKFQLKEAKEESEKMKKSYNLQQLQIQKLKAGFDEEKKRNESQTLQFQNVKKELDLLKREKKQAATSHSATEVRLNRATEELEKLKLTLQKHKTSEKDCSTREQKEMERLKVDNKRLERLRNDSLTVMKKQQKLIGILKRQILHIEAAKLLSFTEDEFVKALDWGSK